jgi:hypothetical protein
MSLAEAQLNALKMQPVGVQLAGGFKRASDWRPLQESDFQDEAAPSSGVQYFHAAADEVVHYYWRQ